MAGDLPELPVGEWWRYLVSAVGAVLLVVGVGTVLLDGRLTGEELLQIASLVVLCGLLVVFDARFAMDIADRGDAFRVLTWMSGGILALAALGVWAGIVVPTAETNFESALLFLSALAAGALFGAVVGYYNVRVRGLVERASREEARREFLDEQQATLSTLNGILRHQILNDLSAISGQAELLDAGKIDADDATESIVDHCDHMAATVERIETFVDVVTWVTDTSTSPVGEAVDRATATLRDDHPDADITVEGDTDATVLADELLYLAVHEVLDNAVVHGRGSVTVTVDAFPHSVVIAVRDEGGEVGVSPPAALFEPNIRGPASDGDGLGLFLADLILDRYDGTLRLAETEPTTFEIEVPNADGRMGAVRPV
jgi:signal transduction histidine kinase